MRHFLKFKHFFSWIIIFLLASCETPEDETKDTSEFAAWRVQNGSKSNLKYSSLNQINRENVHLLEVAWEYKAGDDGFSIECNPIVIGNKLYATSPSVNAFALEASTGKALWTFDPYQYEGKSGRLTGSWAVNRGVAYWEDKTESRIFFGAGPYVYALDAETGKAVTSFGENGRIDLLKNLDHEVVKGTISVTSPVMVYKNLIIVGGRVSEDPGNSIPGHIRAYDVFTGERKWIFHTIPHPGEFGYDTWPDDAWKKFGGANAWSGFSLDEERGLLFFGTGSPSHDHFGHNRPGKNLFGNSVVALKAETGEYVWHYQLVHHDLWDYDLPSPPNLVTFEWNGKTIDAVAQITKMGFLFVFDRETGDPIFPIEEQPVKQSEVPGEQTWPTQPVPVYPPAFAYQGFKESDITDRTPEAAEFVRKNIFEVYGESNLYDPPSFKGDVVTPQFNGGTDWGGAAFDPQTGTLYVNTSNDPELLRVVENDDEDTFPYDYTGHQPLKDNDGYPIILPPWGTLTAIDLTKGAFLWQIPFGNYPGMEGKYEGPTGTYNMGGPMVTAGGLVFLGGSMDEMFRAFDKETGQVLWEAKLPAGGYATPATYSVDGKQYVVIAAGGGGKPGTRTGDSYVAYALPEPGKSNPKKQKEIVISDETTLGEQIYISRCSSCHQYNGQGLGQDFPPLAGTDWVTGDKKRLITVILEGLSGEIDVNGVTYNGAMPPWEQFLDDEQVAILLTYLRSSWGNSASPVSSEEVKAVRKSMQEDN